MKTGILGVPLVIVAFLFGGRWSDAADDPHDKTVKLIASGPDFAIHQFVGFVEPQLFESVLRCGFVISHTNLKSGEMRWLVSTGFHSVPTRRISYSLTRLVGLVEDGKCLTVVIYASGRLFTKDDNPALNPDPKNGHYILQMFSKADGKAIYAWSFTDPAVFPESVPPETTEAGVIKKTEKGYTVFGSVFKFSETGEVIRE
jgi:hypothetical protein